MMGTLGDKTAYSQVGLIGQPGKFDALWSFLNGANCILPVIIADEVA
jgi:hypothetical protein